MAGLWKPGWCNGAGVQEVVELEWNDTSWWGRAYWFVVAAALSGSRRGTCHMVGISKNTSCLQALNKMRWRQSGRLSYGGPVVLFSAYKVVIPNAE